jgi:glutaminyl-tRNA synthetase
LISYFCLCVKHIWLNKAYSNLERISVNGGRKVKGVIHFVEASKALKAEFRIYDRLFLDPNPSNFDEFSSSINTNSLKIRIGFVEPNMLNAKAEIAYQFEREGYFCRDNQSDGLVFNKTVGLRDTWNQ